MRLRGDNRWTRCEPSPGGSLAALKGAPLEKKEGRKTDGRGRAPERSSRNSQPSFGAPGARCTPHSLPSDDGDTAFAFGFIHVDRGLPSHPGRQEASESAPGFRTHQSRRTCVGSATDPALWEPPQGPFPCPHTAPKYPKGPVWSGPAWKTHPWWVPGHGVDGPLKSCVLAVPAPHFSWKQTLSSPEDTFQPTWDRWERPPVLGDVLTTRRLPRGQPEPLPTLAAAASVVPREELLVLLTTGCHSFSRTCHGTKGCLLLVGPSPRTAIPGGLCPPPTTKVLLSPLVYPRGSAPSGSALGRRWALRLHEALCADPVDGHEGTRTDLGRLYPDRSAQDAGGGGISRELPAGSFARMRGQEHAVLRGLCLSRSLGRSVTQPASPGSASEGRAVLADRAERRPSGGHKTPADGIPGRGACHSHESRGDS